MPARPLQRFVPTPATSTTVAPLPLLLRTDWQVGNRKHPPQRRAVELRKLAVPRKT